MVFKPGTIYSLFDLSTFYNFDRVLLNPTNSINILLSFLLDCIGLLKRSLVLLCISNTDKMMIKGVDLLGLLYLTDNLHLKATDYDRNRIQQKY